MRITLQPAFVLHHRPYRETSLIVDLLTKEHGRISAIARGVRTPKSRTRSLIQPFTPLLVSWQGKSELMTLTTIETNEAPYWLKGDCLLSGFYLNELLVRILHKHDPHPQIYTIYRNTLLELQNPQSIEKTLRIFEKKLLEELGYGLQLQYDIHPEQQYCFISDQGFTIYQNEDIAQVRIFSGKSLLAFAAETLDTPDSLRDAKRLIRLALAPLLGQQSLHSRKLFVEVEKNDS